MKAILRFFSNSWQILLLLLLATAAITGFAVGKYITQQQLENELGVTAEGKILLEITQGASGEYTITNVDPANAPAYVRFTVVATWRTTDANELWATPTQLGTDYSVTASSSMPIAKNDVTYFYFCGSDTQDGVLDIGENFGLEVEALTSKPGYTLHFEIIAEGVQCLPTSIAKNAWGVTYDAAANKWVQ